MRLTDTSARGRLCPLIPSSAPRIGRRCARRPLVAPSHPRRSSWTAACPAGRTAVIVSAGGTDSLRTYRYQSPMRGAFMLAFVLEPSSPTRSHSPSTRAIGAAYAALCGVETHRARCCDTRKTPRVSQPVQITTHQAFFGWIMPTIRTSEFTVLQMSALTLQWYALIHILTACLPSLAVEFLHPLYLSPTACLHFFFVFISRILLENE
jgi:hypothetical protein